jgi:hypothetical protein
MTVEAKSSPPIHHRRFETMKRGVLGSSGMEGSAIIEVLCVAQAAVGRQPCP